MITKEQTKVLYKLAQRTRRWALKHGGGSSESMCGDSSAVFCRRFRDRKRRDNLLQGVVCRFVEGYFLSDKNCNPHSPPPFSGALGHCWVEINGEYILDVTVDQFNEETNPPMPPIFFDVKEKWLHRYDGREYGSGLGRRIDYGIYRKKTEKLDY